MLCSNEEMKEHGLTAVINACDSVTHFLRHLFKMTHLFFRIMVLNNSRTDSGITEFMSRKKLLEGVY